MSETAEAVRMPAMIDGWCLRGTWRVPVRYAAIATLALVAAVVAAPAFAGPKIVFDVRTGAVLHAENIDDPWYPASVTKLMTMYVALEAVGNGRLSMDGLLAASANAVAQPPSRIGIGKGQTITLRNALRLLIVKSANDIAVTVAEGVSGSVAAFADEMNRTARRLGMTRTRFVNPHGLPDKRQVTTARDMAVLARALSTDYPESVRLTRVPFLKMGKRTIKSHNALLGRYEGADGMKTGFICAAGFNMVATATRRGQRIGVVVFGETSSANRKVTAEELLDLGFAEPRRGLRRKPNLKTFPKSGSAAGPVNMRPNVCRAGVIPASKIAGLEPLNYSGPIVAIVYGSDFEVAPLPSPRPSHAMLVAARTVGGNILTPDIAPPTIHAIATVEAMETATAPIPLPMPRPAGNRAG